MGVLLLLAGLAAQVAAVPLASDAVSSSTTLVSAQTSVAAALSSPSEYTLPSEDPNLPSREQGIQEKMVNLLYGQSLIGQSSFFPGGPLGANITARDVGLWERDAVNQTTAALTEAVVVLKDIQDRGGLKTLEDYSLLYDGHWAGAVPLGIAQGQLTNYTEDLLFSMERLSTNPFIIERLHPGKALPYTVPDHTVKAITGDTLDSLHRAGRLFVADHSYQKAYTQQPNRFAAACTALFYLEATTNFLLPLSIKTNTGADLTYTPLDDPNDWLLAKIMFSANDLFHSQIYHLAATHAVAEIANLAALRVMSDRHPVLALLQRFMYQAYALRPVGTRVLFNVGGFFEQNFPYYRQSVYDWENEFYVPDAGLFEANYLRENLHRRGLIDADYGPELAHFPFYEDGSALLDVIRKFITAFVDSIYDGSDDAVAKDTEVQAWVGEANGPAQVLDFPASITTRAGLVDVLTHMAWLTGVAHHDVNQGEPVTASGVLPLHPASLFAPLPEAKGLGGDGTDLMKWLPDAAQSVQQISLLARFNRPGVVATNQTLRYMFAAPNLLVGNGPAYEKANEVFMEEMGRISEKISARGFDATGLSQGMPFIWRGLDPGVVPFFLSV